MQVPEEVRADAVEPHRTAPFAAGAANIRGLREVHFAAADLKGLVVEEEVFIADSEAGVLRKTLPVETSSVIPSAIARNLVGNFKRDSSRLRSE